MSDRYRIIVASSIVLGILALPIMLYIPSRFWLPVGLGLGWIAGVIVPARKVDS